MCPGHGTEGLARCSERLFLLCLCQSCHGSFTERPDSQDLSWRSPSVLTTALLRDTALGLLMPINVDIFNQWNRLGRGVWICPGQVGRRVTKGLEENVAQSIWPHSACLLWVQSCRGHPRWAPVHHPRPCVEVSESSCPRGFSVSLTLPQLL